MTFSELARERFSVRSFSGRPVEEEKLAQILEAGRIAPTARNNQPQRIKVITSPEELEKVDKCTPCRFGAPVVLLICYDKRAAWKRPFDGALSGEVDSSIVKTHMMFAAQEQGLGSLWVMHFDPAKATELFALPEYIVPVALLPLGYPSENASPSERHGKRAALADLLL